MSLGYVHVETKINDEKQIISFAGHFDRHGGAPVQYEAHRPMKHAPSYSGSHWMPQLGDYSFRILLAATRATINKTMSTGQ